MERAQEFSRARGDEHIGTERVRARHLGRKKEKKATKMPLDGFGLSYDPHDIFVVSRENWVVVWIAFGSQLPS